MEKIIFILTALILSILSSCGPNTGSSTTLPSSDSDTVSSTTLPPTTGQYTGSSTTRAGIIAEGFVKADVISADDLIWNLVGVDETSLDEYHVVADIKTLNGLGMLVPRKVSVRLKYNGGDWSDIFNWTLISIKYLDESTGRVQ